MPHGWYDEPYASRVRVRYERTGVLAALVDLICWLAGAIVTTLTTLVVLAGSFALLAGVALFVVIVATRWQPR